MDYDVVAFTIPPVTVNGHFASLLDTNEYIDFLMDILDIMPRKKKLIIFDCMSLKNSKGPVDIEKRKALVVEYFLQYTKQLKLFKNPLTILLYTEEVAQTILSFAEYLKKCIDHTDIALFNSPDPNTYYNENKDYLAYAIGKGAHKLHFKNIFEYQPVGPLYGTNDLLGDVTL